MTPETNTEFPDPFQFEDGTRVRTAADWPRRAAEIRNLIVDIEYGAMPSAPSETLCEELHTAPVDRFAEGALITTCRVTAQPHSFILHLLVPGGPGPFPVVLNGDACWRYATDEVTAEILRRGNIFAQFNRVEIAPDVPGSKQPPSAPSALAAWAWGYHRCVDVLARMDFVDPSRIAINGHSRGGKATLLAGATDHRIGLVCANDSGCGGAGSHLWHGPNCEKIADALRVFPYWYGPRLAQFIDREPALPFDQHFLKALIAPRPLLTTEALGDLWANPSGTWQTHIAAREVYRFLGAQDRIGIWYREGGHVHNAADWRAFLDFMDWHFRGTLPQTSFDSNPFPDLPKPFS